MAAQTFILWSRLGVWERLLAMAQERGVALGMAFLDGTAIRAHQKAAGARSNKRLRRRTDLGERPRRSVGPGAASAPRPA
jgi:hypothetical protein